MDNFCINLKSRAQVFLKRARQGDRDLELQELRNHVSELQERGRVLFDNFMELPSLHDKILYLGEAIMDHKWTVGVAGTAVAYMTAKHVVRGFVRRRAKVARSVPWKRAFSRPDVRRKTIFSHGDDSHPSRMLI